MAKEDKRRLLIIGGTVIVAAVVLWLLTGKKTGPATVIQQGGGGISIPGAGPIVLNGSDPRLIYTPAELSGREYPSLNGGSSRPNERGLNFVSPPQREMNLPNASDAPGEQKGGCCGGQVMAPQYQTQSFASLNRTMEPATRQYLPFATGR